VIIRQSEVTPFDFDGLAIRDYTAGHETASSFAVITVPPGAVHAQAWSRRSDKYYYVVSGTVEFLDSGEAHTLSIGDFCLVPQGEHFSYRNVSDTAATLCLFHTPSFDAGSEMTGSATVRDVVLDITTSLDGSIADAAGGISRLTPPAADVPAGHDELMGTDGDQRPGPDRREVSA
jgi:mannose-6-phosphate isomerase-like protein (cupin superfamily)